MRPAFSVVFLTTLIGAGQGLFLALFAVDLGQRSHHFMPDTPPRFFVLGAALSVALSALGLLASFFHLGRPERAWRAAACWRTSWLSREVIALPAFMALAALYGAAHHLGWPTLGPGLAALAACLALFYCTAMIYACIKFLPEWASGFTLANFVLMGCASGFTAAFALGAFVAPRVVPGLAVLAIALTLMALVTRLGALSRNRRLAPRSTLQTAIGVASPRIRQISQGFTGASFNTLEFFHGRTPEAMRAIRRGFIVLGFVVPIALIVLGSALRSPVLAGFGFVVQFAGFAMERWYFLAEGNHVQNLYYQGTS